VGIDGALDGLTAFLAARDDAERKVAPDMRSQLHRGRSGAGAFVLLHGLTASPPAWRGIAAALHAGGHTVVVPRLLYHGYANRMTRALRHLRPGALLEDVRRVVVEVATLGEPVTVVGHSLGATLAISVALHEPAVDRIVPIAPFMGIVSVPLELHPLLIGAMASVPDVFVWWDPVQREKLEPSHGYPRYPLRALATGIRLADEARASANAPPHARGIDLVINERESSVNNRTALRLALDWRAAGASVAIHHLRGLGWSHDIIEPDRLPAQAARAVLVEIIDRPHEPVDREHRIDVPSGGVR
jgi:alpha-beta hydrolase superfamily lysophospholipase